MTIPVLCGLIAANAYLVSKSLALIQDNITHREEASELQADIALVVFDLQAMETGQRGYLLTGDSSYLNPYTEAEGRLPVHFANLRSRLAGKAPRDRSLETQLESVAESMIAEMKETIRLRELGYRHRAFLIVASNRGRESMEKARTTLAALSSAQTANLARYDRAIKESVSRAVIESVLASGILLLVTMVTFLAFNRNRSWLEVEFARQAEELRATRLQLEQFTSSIFQDFRAMVEQTRSYAHSLLEVYGGFLPRQGQEKAERIESGAAQMLHLLDNLSGNSTSENSVEVIDASSPHRFTA